VARRAAVSSPTRRRPRRPGRDELEVQVHPRLDGHPALPPLGGTLHDQSAGKRRSGRTRRGSKHLNAALKDAAMAAMRTNDSYLQALY
jgi:hypothetical protein